MTGPKYRFKAYLRRLKGEPPGERFTAEFQRNHALQETMMQRLLISGFAVLCVIVGLLLSIPPAVPGFLLWLPALGLLAARSETLARLLDAAELWAHRLWQRLQARRRRGRKP